MRASERAPPRAGYSALSRWHQFEPVAGGVCDSSQAVPTLHALTAEWLALHSALTLDNAPSLLEFAKRYRVPALVTRVDAFCSESWEVLCDRHPHGRLRSALGADLHDAIRDEHAQIASRVALRLQKGAAVEPRGVTAQPLGRSPTSGRPTLPYELLRGSFRERAWPSEIDADQRERYLPTDEFERVLGCTPARFASLPTWKQMDLKKEADLY